MIGDRPSVYLVDDNGESIITCRVDKIEIETGMGLREANPVDIEALYQVVNRLNHTNTTLASIAAGVSPSQAIRK